MPEQWGGQCWVAAGGRCSPCGAHSHLAGASPQHCPTAHTSLQPAPAEPRNSPSSPEGCYRAPAEGFGAGLPPTLQIWEPMVLLTLLVQSRKLSGHCISQQQHNPLAHPALLNPSDHPPLPQADTGSWNTAGHWRLPWALTLYQEVRQEPR